MAEEFPPFCLRGMQSRTHMDARGRPSRKVFEPDCRPGKRQADGTCELSINWHDDAGALEEIRNRKPPFEKIARLATETIELLEGVYRREYPNALRHVRSRQPGNDYHGDLLFLADENIRLIMAQSLAVNSTVLPNGGDIPE